jgi:aldehyde:ferredoxin oxidoreductase
MDLKGYMGKLLWVDLTREKIEARETPENLVKAYIGGKGLGARLLYDLSKPKINPLSPDNPLMFMLGPLVATGVPAATKAALITKSPHTHTFLDSYGSGYWPSWLKLAGYDGLILLGRAERLSYLYIGDDGVELRDAGHLKGKGVFETTDILVRDVGDKAAKVATIGPAGENLVEYACVSCDYHHSFGREGGGAVMGSKNLKAIIVSTDNRDVEISKPDEFDKFLSEVNRTEIMGPDHEWARTDGTPIIIDWSNETGLLPTHNFRMGVFKYADEINAETLRRYRTTKYTCYRCPIACRNIVEVRRGKYRGVKLEGPEYETIAMSGSNCGIRRFDAIVKWNYIVDDLGMDTISAGATIAMAMEAYQRGYLKSEDLDGLELKFGNEDAWINILNYIAFRKGIGDVLAGGVKRLAEYLGGDAWKFALHIKGSEMPAYDPRGSFGMALAYGTSDRGACHLRAWPVAYEAFGDMDPFTPEGKAKVVIEDQDRNSVKWSMVICDFYAVGYETMAKFYTLVTGREVSTNELREIGERIWNMTRLYNIREGFSRDDDFPPYRIMSQSLKHGPPKGKKVTKKIYWKMLMEYYKLRGWTAKGVPTKKKLKSLGIKA